MDEQRLRAAVAKNIAALRKEGGMTQSELAQELNYSDKLISKWERGDGLPDVPTLCRLAEFFGVETDELTGFKPLDPKKKFRACGGIKPLPLLPPPHKRSHYVVPLLSAGLVWLCTAAAAFVLELCGIALPLLFCYALPVTFIVLLVFACLWYGHAVRAVCVSGIIWTTVLSLCLTFGAAKLRYLFLAAGVLQILTVVWFWFQNKNKNNQTERETQC